MSAELSITVFVLFSTGFLIALPFWKKQFAKNQLVDLLLKRCCWSIAAYLMVLNSAIMATIASTASLTLTDELFRYMWLWGTGGWIFLGFTVLKTLFDIVELWKKEKNRIRMGGDGDGF